MAESTLNTVVVEEDRVILYDDLATAVIYDQLDYSGIDAEAATFLERFEIVKPDRGYFEADPDEDYYQGISVMAIIRRKSDGRLFGYQYWTPIAKYADADIEPNGILHGFEFDPPAGFDWNNDHYPHVYVWLPVEPFTITGYKINDTKESK